MIKKMQLLAEIKTVLERIPALYRDRFTDLIPADTSVSHHVHRRKRKSDICLDGPLTYIAALESLTMARRMWAEPLASRTSVLAPPSDESRTAYMKKRKH